VKVIITPQSLPGMNLPRRQFFRLAGAGAAATLLVTASSCSKKTDIKAAAGPPDIGAGDVGILNLIFALQQLEQKFYSKVSAPPSVISFTHEEKILLAQILIHEGSHMDVLKKYLGTSGLPELSPDFSTIDFNDREKFLGTARLLENNAVACMNSLAYQLKNPELVTFVAKMVSVDARHAAYVNNLISAGDFYDATYVDLNTGMERPKTVSEILTFINSFLSEKITANHL
jgi:hypothetical protein